MRPHRTGVCTALAPLLLIAGARAAPAQQSANEAFPRWSSDGTRLVFTSDRDGDPEIYVAPAGGPGAVRLTFVPGRDAHAAFSPDDAHLVFQSPRANGTDTNIYRMNADGSAVVQLTTLTGFAGVPVYSPDAKSIAFQWRRTSDFADAGKWRICVMDADGGHLRCITDGTANDQVPGFSRDGRRLLFYSDRTGRDQLYTIAVDGTDVRRVLASDANDSGASWSPDDARIAFVSDRSGNPELYVMNADGSNLRRLTHTRATERAPAWSPDGGRLVFSADGDGPSAIYVVDADGTGRRRLTAPGPLWLVRRSHRTLPHPTTCRRRRPMPSQRLVPSVIALAPLAFAACAGSAATGDSDRTVTGDAIRPALASITTQDLLRGIGVLAHDSMEGRSPGTIGEERTVRYLEGEFRRMGLAPGNPDGTYVQDVPLVGITPEVSASLSIDGRTITLEGPRDYIASSRRAVPQVTVGDSELVFVGYGVVAPEYGWDDYKGVDVTGKTIVMLVNDPPLPDPVDPTRLDASMFRGSAMTYYGRWTYKYEVAAAAGAAAAIVIHETGPAGYPFEVLSAGFERENFDIRSQGAEPPVAVQAWMPEPAARRYLQQMGHDFDALKQRALSRDFRPVPLNARVSFALRQQLRDVASRNVVAKLEGARRPDEYVIYTAHWDHLGRDASRAGDQIYNGAADNASGTAAVLEIAQAFTTLPQRPDRTILFLAVTAEERGLLGAKYYAENPLYPLERTLANVNVDGMNLWGRTEDLVVIGLGNSTLDDVLREAAATQGRVLEPDAEPEKGFYYRSDHFEFAKQGVPALYTDDGTRFIGKPADYGRQKRAAYTANDYHKPSDEVKPDWDLAGAVEDARLLFQLGWLVSQRAAYPEWKEGAEFKARREQMLRAR